jgi:hypothetical protein
MKWLLQRDYEQPATYHLYDGGYRIAWLAYNTNAHSIRLTYAEQRRTFFLRSGGFFSGKIALLNEYGQAVGKGSFPDRKDEGVIQVEAVRLHYSFDETLPAVLLRDDTSKRLVKVCRLAFVRSMNVEEQMGLLLSLAWLFGESAAFSGPRQTPALANY